MENKRTDIFYIDQSLANMKWPTALDNLAHQCSIKIILL